MPKESVPGENSILVSVRNKNCKFGLYNYTWMVKIKLVVLQKGLYLSFNFDYSCMIVCLRFIILIFYDDKSLR